MTEQTFYVLIVGPGGEQNYIKCDPSRLARNSFRLYIKTTVRDGVAKYTAVNGSHAISKLDEVDVTLPLEAFKDLKEQCRDVLQAQGEFGDRLFGELFDALDLPRLMSAVARADVEDAQAAVQHIMYGVMGLASRCACELAETHSRAEHMTSAVESIGSVLDQAPNMNREIYLNWSTAADGLNSAVQRLREIEDGARAILNDVECGQRAWVERMDRTSPTLKEAMAALETDDDAFILKAFGFRGEPEKCDEMLEAVEKATRHIEACRNLERACRDAWDMTVQSAHERTAKLREGLPKALAELKSDTRKLSEFESQYGKDIPRPFVADPGLIDEVAYNAALSRLCDEAWGPMNCERRMCHLFDGIFSLCAMRPELPDDVANAVRMADQYAAEALRELEEATAPVSAPSVVSSSPPLPTATPVVALVAPEGSASSLAREVGPGASGVYRRREVTAVKVSRARTEEIYRLMTAVAYVLTVENRRPFTSSTVNSLLRIAVRLGKCTEDEAASAKPTIKEWYERDMVKVESLKEAMALQDTAKERWIRFKLRRYVAKLAVAYADEARRTMAEHALTSVAVRQAHAETRADCTRRFNEKKAAANGGAVGEDHEESDD